MDLKPQIPNSETNSPMELLRKLTVENAKLQKRIREVDLNSNALKVMTMIMNDAESIDEILDGLSNSKSVSNSGYLTMSAKDSKCPQLVIQSSNENH